MNWFKGSIPEAISSAKLSNGIFIVYIYDKTELSTKTRETLNKEEVSKTLNSSNNVAIEIENGTPNAIQFAQIYPLIVVPSVFFISPQSGIPLEVIGGNFEEKSLIEKYKKIAPKQNEISDSKVEATSAEQPSDKESSQPANTASAQTVGTNSEGTDNVAKSSTSEDEKSLKTEEKDASPVANATEGASSIILPEGTQSEANSQNLDEKIARAKELLNRRQEEKYLEQIEEEKQKELDRRRQSQELLKAQKRREDQERLDMSKQRRKDKEDDRLARERVRSQIAADRAEREARDALLKGEQPLAAPAPLQPPAVAPSVRPNEPNSASVTRIKFRFPDNSSAMAKFPPEATLSDVRVHILQECRLPFRNFRMVGALPPQTFTEDQMPLTLTELKLTPSAIIIVKPISESTSAKLVPSGEGIMTIFWSLIAPLTFVLNYVRGLLGLGARRQTPPRSDSSDEEDFQSSKRPRTEGSYTTRNRPKTAYGRRGEHGEFLRREGNIHRISRRDDDDDDDNNTWNGNSTQQM